MPNANTVDRIVGAPSPAQGSGAIPAFTPSGTSATIVLNQPGNAAVVSARPAGALGGSASFAANFDGNPFKVRVAGKVTTAASANITVAILCQNSSTYTSGNVIATTAATAVNSTTQNFVLEATCMWDSVTAKINGFQIGQIANTLVSAAAVTNAVAVTALSGLNFNIAVTTSSGGNATFYFSEFAIEAL